jgi:hypothetical protein
VAGAWEIVNPAFRRGTVAATFHGRDVFAPAAARLAAGARAADAGPAVELAGRLSGAAAARRAKGKGLAGTVIHVDRFGNLITDVAAARLGPRARVKIGRLSLPISRTYEDVARGKPLAYIGSTGTLEIAVRDGSAAARLKVRRGAPVVVQG